MKRRDVVELLLLAALWGGSFLFMRVAAPQFGAFALMALRTGIGALVLLPFVMFGYATQHLGASYTSILDATTRS